MPAAHPVQVIPVTRNRICPGKNCGEAVSPFVFDFDNIGNSLKPHRMVNFHVGPHLRGGPPSAAHLRVYQIFENDGPFSQIDLSAAYQK